MPQTKSSSLDGFRDRLYQQAKDVLDAGLAAMDADPDNVDLAQTVYEVWSRNMGALDAMMCLRGVPYEARQKSLRQGILEGKRLSLDAHAKVCRGCENSDALREEIDSLN
jgi:hypothetical protein